MDGNRTIYRSGAIAVTGRVISMVGPVGEVCEKGKEAALAILRQLLGGGASVL